MVRFARLTWASVLAVGLLLPILEAPAFAAPTTCKPAKKKGGPAPAPKEKKGKPPPAAEPDPPPAAPASDVVPNTQFRGPTRIDFDDRLIQGQTNKSGAVYLFDRKETGIDSMVRRRKSFKALTISSIYDR